MYKMKMTVTAAVAAVFVTGLAAVGAAAEKPAPAVAPPEAIKAAREDKWGIVVGLGPYNVAMGDVYSRGRFIPVEVFDNLYKKWKPDRFDARQLVDVVKRSGARQLVFQVTDLNGFSLYDTKFSDIYKITGPGSPWKRDLFKEVADACHAQGLKLWIGYSSALPPSGLVGSPKEYAANQLRELLTNYGRIEGILFIKQERIPRDQQSGIVTLCQTLQPHILLKVGVGAGWGGWPNGDIEDRDDGVRRSRYWRLWTNTPMHPCWVPEGNGYIAIPPEALIGEVVWRVVNDGMWHPSLGLMPDGRIEPETVEMLRQVGEWMGKYGESLYATRGGPFDYSVWGGSTYRGKFVYLHVLSWPGDTIHLKPMERKIVSATVLTGGTATVKQTDQVIEVQVPKAQRVRPDTIIKLELDGPVDDMKPIPLSLTLDSINDERANAIYRRPGFNIFAWNAAHGHFHKPARSSDGRTNQQPYSLCNQARPSVPIERPEWSYDYSAEGFTNKDRPAPESMKRSAAAAVDGHPLSRWECEKGVNSAWLEVDLRKKETFSHTAINELGDRVRRFELQVRDQDREDEPWRTVYTGTTIGGDFYATFPATTARYVRLNLIETTDGPAIFEFQVW